MIYIPPAMRAKLYLSMCEALEVNDTPNSPEEAQRLALAQLVTGYTGEEGNFALHEAFRLADALAYWLIDYGDEGPHGFSIANVACLVGGDRDVAKAALRLLGARPTFDVDGPDDWSTAPGSRSKSIRFPCDILVNRLRCELEEAQSFTIPRRYISS